MIQTFQELMKLSVLLLDGKSKIIEPCSMQNEHNADFKVAKNIHTRRSD